MPLKHLLWPISKGLNDRYISWSQHSQTIVIYYHITDKYSIKYISEISHCLLTQSFYKRMMFLNIHFEKGMIKRQSVPSTVLIKTESIIDHLEDPIISTVWMSEIIYMIFIVFINDEQ